MSALFSDSDAATWLSVYQNYKVIVGALSATKKKAKVPLIELDDWYQRTLPKVVQSRNPHHFQHDELVRLVEWKLLRGKFRPRLFALAQSNSAKDVENVTSAALKLLHDGECKSALKKLCELKGIGPATASAILCAGSRGSIPFMADESMSAVPELGAVAYTEKRFLHYTKKLEEKADVLNKKDVDNHWTPHKVELALWTYVVAHRMGIKLDMLDEDNNLIDTNKSKDSSADMLESGSRPSKRRKKEH